MTIKIIIQIDARHSPITISDSVITATYSMPAIYTIGDIGTRNHVARGVMVYPVASVSTCVIGRGIYRDTYHKGGVVSHTMTGSLNNDGKIQIQHSVLWRHCHVVIESFGFSTIKAVTHSDRMCETCRDVWQHISRVRIRAFGRRHDTKMPRGATY